MTLSILEQKAAELRALGRPDSEIAANLSMKPDWVAKLNLNPEFKPTVERLRDEYSVTRKNMTKHVILQEIRVARKQVNESADLLYEVASMCLDKLRDRLLNLDPDEFTGAKVPGSIKMLADTMQSVTTLRNQGTGMDRIIKEIENIKKIGNVQENSDQSLLNQDE